MSKKKCNKKEPYDAMIMVGYMIDDAIAGFVTKMKKAQSCTELAIKTGREDGLKIPNAKVAKIRRLIAQSIANAYDEPEKAHKEGIKLARSYDFRDVDSNDFRKLGSRDKP